ncbi:hypothetical protein Zmor_023188 [Zophobas morio]|uniref:Uncharacterized protein n=1 Tax=Zophobas morio TaxID=2755281 RepID=A0AA38HYT0_9CUCU|nr:hypothetical protein Zmor_023188 [Zophobas morio]
MAQAVSEAQISAEHQAASMGPSRVGRAAAGLFARSSLDENPTGLLPRSCGAPLNSGRNDSLSLMYPITPARGGLQLQSLQPAIVA